MFHIQWGAQPRRNLVEQRAYSPFGEMELAMSSFRNNAFTSFFGSSDPFTSSLDDEMENLMDNSRNLMSLLPVIPSQSTELMSRQNRPRRNRRNRINNHDNSSVANTLQEITEDHVTHNVQQNRTNRGNTLRNFLDRNNHVFPAPDPDRQNWYDPNERIPDNRIPNIPPRVLTLAQINRIPTKKVAKPGGSCDICLDDFKKGDTTKVLNCKHDYHAKCVDPWLKQHTTCPKCRRQVRAPPENQKKVPRPVPLPCPVRERAREYDRERRARERQEAARQLPESNINVDRQNRAEEIQNVAELPSVETPNIAPISLPTVTIVSEFPVVARNSASQSNTAINASAHPESEQPINVE